MTYRETMIEHIERYIDSKPLLKYTYSRCRNIRTLPTKEIEELFKKLPNRGR